MIAVLIILIILAFFYLLTFNSLIASRQTVTESWSDIDVQLKRRRDLIPNLISSVKEYANHESSIFEQVAEIRSRAISSNPKDIAQLSTVETQLENTIHQLLAVSENYPALKANENFQKLQNELTQTEDEIASARRIYNANVAAYNTKISTVPNNVIAKMNHFAIANYFQNT